MNKYRNVEEVSWMVVAIVLFSFLLFVFFYVLKEVYEVGLLATFFVTMIICVIAFFEIAVIVIFVNELRKPTLARVTTAEKNEIEKWLTDEGYHAFVGKMENNGDGVIIFKVDRERFPFALHGVAEIVHDNYSIKDYGPFRVVQRLDGSTKKAVYRK